MFLAFERPITALKAGRTGVHSLSNALLVMDLALAPTHALDQCSSSMNAVAFLYAISPPASNPQPQGERERCNRVVRKAREHKHAHMAAHICERSIGLVKPTVELADYKQAQIIPELWKCIRSCMQLGIEGKSPGDTERAVNPPTMGCAQSTSFCGKECRTGVQGREWTLRWEHDATNVQCRAHGSCNMYTDWKSCEKNASYYVLNKSASKYSTNCMPTQQEAQGPEQGQ